MIIIDVIWLIEVIDMKKKITIILSIIILASCNNSDGINNPLKRNENWCWIINEKTGDGEWIPISNSESNASGKYTLFFSNGKVRQKGYLKNGIDADTIFYYDINENIISKVFKNKNGEISELMRDGKYKGYYPTCELAVEGEFKNNIQIGTRIEYFKNGNIKAQYGQNGNYNWQTTYSENGQIIDSVNTLNGKLNGISKQWYPNGNLEYIQTFKNDSLTGYFCSYHENGQKRQEGKRWQELADDTLIDWYSNGQIKAKRYYEKGLKQGPYYHWFESGEIQVEGSFIDDKKNGLYQEYYENKRLKKKGNFSNGVKIGKWEFYDENGSLIETKIY